MSRSIPVLLQIRTRRAKFAVGRRSSNGFVVYAGSRAAAELSPSSTGRAYSNLRDALVAAKVLVPSGDGQFAFAQDFTFGSPSAAASVVMGLNANGDSWKPVR
jgi:hypothetical protein